MTHPQPEGNILYDLPTTKKENSKPTFSLDPKANSIIPDPVTDAINSLTYKQRQYLRMHLSNKVHRNLELRNRIEFSLNKTSSATGHQSRGFLIYQDFIYKSLRLPLSFTARACYFDADDFNSRIYAYENDILYSFTIPAFYNQGFRYYLNLRYRIKGLTLEARFEQTRYRDVDTISSGNELIDRNTKSRIKVQCRFAF